MCWSPTGENRDGMNGLTLQLLVGRLPGRLRYLFETPAVCSPSGSMANYPGAELLSTLCA